MEKTRKIGILGGTFNPIHIGHLILAQNAMEEAGLDEVLFIPSGVSYMKDQETVIPASLRAEMVKLATLDNPRFSFSLLEAKREQNSYSYKTVQALKKENPHTRYFFIAGADTLFSMETWKYPDILLSCVTILAACRQGRTTKELDEQIAYLRQKYKADIRLISDSQFDISSSQIRKNIKEGKSIRYLVPERVETYIRDKGLYAG